MSTSGSNWHAREVELVRMVSKSHESPPGLVLHAREVVANRTLLYTREVVAWTAGCRMRERAARVQTCFQC